MKHINQYPTIEECEQLWKEYHTPAHVIGHCQGVTEVALRVAAALNAAGYHFNIPLIRSAGLLHDLLRVEAEHGERAAEVVRRLGYMDVADIIQVHMKYRIPPEISRISETDLVCLGDRVVLEDHFVGLDSRMEYIIKKSKGAPEVEERIRKSFRDIHRFVCAIEEKTGKTLEELMK